MSDSFRRQEVSFMREKGINRSELHEKAVLYFMIHHTEQHDMLEWANKRMKQRTIFECQENIKFINKEAFFVHNIRMKLHAMRICKAQREVVLKYLREQMKVAKVFDNEEIISTINRFIMEVKDVHLNKKLEDLAIEREGV